MVHVFHHPSLVTGDLSDDFPAMLSGTVTSVLARLTTPGTSDTQVTIFQNTLVIGVVTIAASEHVGALVLSSPVSMLDQDYFNVQATIIGDSCEGLWVGVFV